MPPRQPRRSKTSQDTWTAVDRYITDLVVRPEPALTAALAASAAAGLPGINVSPAHGKLLLILAKAIGARRLLEIGTLGGYSTIWLARALPSGGRLISLELDERHATLARANVARAGLAGRVEIRVGPALSSLAHLAAGRPRPFDLVFIDADKRNNPEYLRWALALSRPGSLIVVDNVVRDGAVIDAQSRDQSVQGVRRLNDAMAADPRLVVTEIQTVGEKGYDGFAVALVTSVKNPK